MNKSDFLILKILKNKMKLKIFPNLYLTSAKEKDGKQNETTHDSMSFMNHDSHGLHPHLLLKTYLLPHDILLVESLLMK